MKTNTERFANHRTRNLLMSAAAAAGIAIGAAGIAGAATSSTASTAAVSGSSTAAVATVAPATGSVPAQDPATLSHGPGETVLTGTNASSATAAALAAVPGATIVRVETDAQGSAYEAHMKKADGTYVTVKMDSNFLVTSTDTGFGGPGGGAPHASTSTGA